MLPGTAVGSFRFQRRSLRRPRPSDGPFEVCAHRATAVRTRRAGGDVHEIVEDSDGTAFALASLAMNQRTRLNPIGCLLLLTLSACSGDDGVAGGEVVGPGPVTNGGSGCVDTDGDGYGGGCAPGPDCDDGDPARHDQCPIVSIDLRPTETPAASSHPHDITSTYVATYFVATDPRDGEELFRVSDTFDDATLVVDLLPGADSSSPRKLVPVKNVLYFAAKSYDYGVALFRTEGTPETTALVADIVPGTADTEILETAVIGDALYFTAREVDGGIGLYRTLGTPETTTRIGVSQPSQLVVAGTKLYLFSGPDGQRVLHSVSETTASRLYPHPLAAQHADLDLLTASGNDVFYTVSGTSVRRDGTSAASVASIASEITSRSAQCHATSGEIAKLVPTSNGRVAIALPISVKYCSNTGNGELHWFLSDGAGGHAPLAGFAPIVGVFDRRPTLGAVFARAGGFAFAVCEEGFYSPSCASGYGTNNAVYEYDGSTTRLLHRVEETSLAARALFTTPSDTYYLLNETFYRDVNPLEVSFANGYSQVDFLGRGTTGFYLRARKDGVASLHFYRFADGSLTKLRSGMGFLEGTAKVRMTIGPNWLDSRLFVAGITADGGTELWTSFTTPESTRIVRDLARGFDGSNPGAFTELGNHAVFVADDGVVGAELYRSRGRASDTTIVADLWNGADSGSPGGLLVHDGRLYFSGNDGYTGVELWSLASATSTPTLLADIFGGSTAVPDVGSLPNDSFPSSLTWFGGGLVFAATNGPVDDSEVYRHVGLEPAMAQQVVAVNAAADVGSQPRSFVVVGSKLFFVANDGVHGRVPYVTDGTAPGTVRLQPADLSDDGIADRGLFAFEGGVVFAGKHTTAGIELFYSDGTVQGTRMLDDLNPNGNGAPSEFAILNGRLFFAADDASGDREIHHRALADAAATRLLDLNPQADANPRYLTSDGERIYFSAYHPTFLREPCVTDGTEAGTTCFDLHLFLSSLPRGFLVVAPGEVLFAAATASDGLETFRTDGTVEGTTRIDDACPGTCSSSPTGHRYIRSLNQIYYAADDGSVGREVRVLRR